jgi:hypothetical protein
MKNIIVSLWLILCPHVSIAEEFGRCAPSPEVRFLPDGRKMQLLADYNYTDTNGKLWKAPKDSIVDGASIPKFLWSFIGGPFEGKYRDASVSHDVECDRKTENWKSVHEMFYEEMRCSGVSEQRAKIMYAAVYHCGPRWGNDQSIRYFPCNADFMGQFVRRWKTLVYGNSSISLSELENLNRDRLVASAADPLDEIRTLLAGRGTVSETANNIKISIPVRVGTELDSNSAEVIDKVGAKLKQIPGITINIAGHSDSVGSESENFLLSQHRAAVARQHLINKGINPISVYSQGFGETSPIASNDTPEGRQQNRRIEFIINEEL